LRKDRRKAIKLGDLPIIVGEINPLQERVLVHDICPKCHTKTLSEPKTTIGLGRVWRQCSTCLSVWFPE
jgi:hypothetical protein